MASNLCEPIFVGESKNWSLPNICGSAVFQQGSGNIVFQYRHDNSGHNANPYHENVDMCVKCGGQTIRDIQEKKLIASFKKSDLHIRQSGCQTSPTELFEWLKPNQQEKSIFP